jgi:F-type H+-transporting ATPase subunit epsilon
VKTFVVHLQDATHQEQIDGVVSFVGQDRSGSFGILADHQRMMTMLSFGLSRYRTTDDVWHYVALPGGLLYFLDNVLTLSTRRYIRDDDSTRISRALEEQLFAEEESLRTVKESLSHLEEEMFRRLWRMGRGELA